MSSLSITQLKEQRRWMLWKLETVSGKQTKVPYQPSGRKAMANNPATWHTHGECAGVAAQYSGVGLALGTVDGVSVWGVDIDACCDAVTGKFSPSRAKLSSGWIATGNTHHPGPAVTSLDSVSFPALA